MDRDEYDGETDWWEIADQVSSVDEILAYQTELLVGILEAVEQAGGEYTGTIIGEENLPDASAVIDIPIGPDSFEQRETENDKEIGPGSREDTISIDLDKSALWYEVGDMDRQYSEYQYIVDGANLLDEPQVEPLGLYNDPYRFPQPIIARDTIEVSIRRTDDAPGPEDYFSKIRYVPIRNKTANALERTWKGV